MKTEAVRCTIQSPDKGICAMDIQKTSSLGLLTDKELDDLMDTVLGQAADFETRFIVLLLYEKYCRGSIKREGLRHRRLTERGSSKDD